jgi:hypothetical protein
MDRLVSIFEKIFPPPPGAEPRKQPFAGAEGLTARAMVAERAIRRDQLPEGDQHVPEEPPLDTREFIKSEVMPEFPFKAPSVNSNAAPPIQPNPLPATPPMTAQSAQTAKSSADRIYRRNLMGLAAAIMNQMAQNDVMSHELASPGRLPAGDHRRSADGQVGRAHAGRAGRHRGEAGHGPGGADTAVRPDDGAAAGGQRRGVIADRRRGLNPPATRTKNQSPRRRS